MSKEQKKSMNMINEKHAHKKWLLEERACNKKYIHSGMWPKHVFHTDYCLVGN